MSKKTRKYANNYLCDYATQYPEAVAIRSIDPEHIVKELVHIFACMSIPDEILTDRGANFTSKLLSELYKMLHSSVTNKSPLSANRWSCRVVHIFARVGIPDKILTDQGANFTSKLLSELYKMLHIHQLRTSPTICKPMDL